MKKIIATLLALICVIGLFAGCNKTPGNETKPQTTDPVTGEVKEVITIGLPVNTNVEDYETNGLTLWIEEKTGYDLQFQIYASSAADYKTQLATQLLDPSIKLPDMLWRMTSLGDNVWKQYGEEGYFINLKPYFDDKEKSKVWWDRVSMFDEAFINNVLRRCTADNGEIYAYPNIERGLVDSCNYLVSINKKWLAEVGMEHPTNPEELYKVLKAFKEKCCKDATYYPLFGGAATYIGGDVLWWIITMFCDNYDYDRRWGLSEDGKTIEAPFTSPEYREALIYIKKLMDEGLVPNSIASISATDMKKVMNSTESKVGVYVGHTTVSFTTVDNPALYDFEPLDLYGFCQRAEYGNSRSVFITEDAANPDACWEILMLLASEEGAYRVRYGVEGKNWDWCKEENLTSYMGIKCDIKLYDDPFGRIGNDCHGNASPTVNPNAESETCYLGELSPWMQARYNLNGGNYENFTKHEAKNKYTMPVIVLTVEETETNKNERSNVGNVINTYRTKFTKGTDGMDPADDADWKAYLDELDAMGLKIYMDQMQSIYEERYMAEVLAAANN